MLPLTYNGNTCMEEVFVITGLKNNLLGIPTIKELSLITNVCAIENSIILQCPSLFHVQVTFTHEYEIKLKPNSQPFSLSMARNIPISLRAKV